MKQRIRSILSVMILLVLVSLTPNVSCAAKPQRGQGGQGGRGEQERVYDRVDKNAKFQNGNVQKFEKWVAKHVDYPKKSIQRMEQGRAVVRFVVEKNGSISSVEIYRSSGYKTLDKAAVDAVRKSANWTPAYENGTPVRSYIIIPVNFELTVKARH